MLSRQFSLLFFILPLFFLAGCTTLPPFGEAGWRSSPNFDERRPNYIVLHQTTSATAESALRTLTDPERKVSAHYLIGRDGARIQLVDESKRAWHAGESWWGGLTDLNSASIGIELDNTGDEPFSEVQIDALLVLLAEISERHRIPPANIIAHGDIAPRRKVDPSRFFPWQRLAAAGFGLWCAAPPANPPAGFDAMLGLHALGYDISQPEAAIQAFRRHFLGEERAAPLNTAEQGLLVCLIGKKAGNVGP